MIYHHSLLDSVGILSHERILHDVVFTELTVLLGLHEGTERIFADIIVSGFLKSMVVDKIIKALSLVGNNFLGIGEAKVVYILNLCFIHSERSDGGTDGSCRSNDVSEVGLAVSELGSEETVHGVVETRDFGISHEHLERFEIRGIDVLEVGR